MKLPPAVLAALGLAAVTGTPACSATVCLSIVETGIGPCLGELPETGDTETGDSDTETGIGPCLDIPEDSGDSGGGGQKKSSQDLSEDVAKVVHRLAADGILAPDVVKRLLEEHE